MSELLSLINETFKIFEVYDDPIQYSITYLNKIEYYYINVLLLLLLYIRMN